MNKNKLKKLSNLIMQMEYMIQLLRNYMVLNGDLKNQKILKETDKIYNLPVHQKVVDRIVNNPNTTPQQKVQIANTLKKTKLAQRQVRNAVQRAATQVTSDELALSFMNQNHPEAPYKIVPDAAYGKSK
jgi:tRNA A22 N-methylase